MTRAVNKAIIPSIVINQKIHFLRGTRVMLDSDLASLYGVTTSSLNQAVERNRERFPEDFMFRLEKEDAEFLRFTKCDVKGCRPRGGAVRCRMRLLSRALRCCRACCEADAPCK
jgi:hypothetical protein